MTNNDLRELLLEQGHEDTILLEGDEFADGVLGVTEDGHLVYGYNEIIDSLMKAWDCPEQEAIDWLEYNTIRSIAYMRTAGKEPIIVLSLG